MQYASLLSRGITTKYTAIAAAALLTCLIAWQVYLFWESLQAAQTSIATAPKPPPAQQNKLDIGRLAATHLFGDVEAGTPQYSEAREDKSLKLTLRGIVANSGGKTSLAIIESGPNNEETFALGDNVFNKGTLDFVAADHVILARGNGQLAKLQLPETDASGIVSEEYLPPAQFEPAYPEPQIQEPQVEEPVSAPLEQNAELPDAEPMASDSVEQEPPPAAESLPEMDTAPADETGRYLESAPNEDQAIEPANGAAPE